MSRKCVVCGSNDKLEKVSKNKMKIRYVCDCGTLYCDSGKKRRKRNR